MGKKYKNLYDQVCNFENIWLATRKARKGKRYKEQTVEFEYDLEKNIFEIQEQLINENFQFGKYNEFKIFEPKERLICAAPYRDRVVHHSLCNILEPVLDKAMIFDSYACRRGKGTHAALNRVRHFLRSSQWVLKLDIKKYFFTIDHEILLEEIKKKIRDKKILRLIELILDTYSSGDEYYYYFDRDNLFDISRKRGLPIGNLTSQLFANYFLNDFDRFLKEDLKYERYVRYMDDALIFANNKYSLKDSKAMIDNYLEKRRLKLHEKKTQIFPVKNGVNFLGFHLYPYRKRILRQNLQRFKSRMKRYRYELASKKMVYENLLLSLNAWLGYADKNSNKRFINEILEPIKYKNKNNYSFSFIILERDGR